VSQALATGTPIALRDFHRFEAHGTSFLYMVPSAGIFRLDEVGTAILALLAEAPRPSSLLVEGLSDRFKPNRVLETVAELRDIQAVGDLDAPMDQVANDLPPEDFPLNTMVLNVTNKCNLACTYCYEYGEDKIVDT
ncbi:uncharacterized protein METZ01_LOCUS368968, partial [marine metagenome]